MPRKYKNIFPVEIFTQQILKIMEEYKLESGADFDRKARLKNWAPRWLNEKYRGKSVEIDILVSICNAFHKPLDWLVFGKESDILITEEEPLDYKTCIYSEEDIHYLAEITIDADNYLKKARLSLSGKRKYVWMALNFEYWFTEHKKPDDDIFKAHLNLSWVRSQNPEGVNPDHENTKIGNSDWANTGHNRTRQRP